MIAHEILETKLISQYAKQYDIFKQNNVLKLNLSNDNIINGLIQDVKSDNVNSTYKKEIITPFGTVKTGDYVTCNNTNFIIESAIDKEIAHDKAYLLECPFSIKIFDWNYSDIREYPIALKNNNARLGVSTSTISITANSSFDIILKYDIHTRSFIQNDNIINGINHAKIQRIILDNMAFSVVGVNHLISDGLLVISIENTNTSPADNLNLGVADYYTYYREPIDYNAIIDTEIAKYETTATITKDILNGADVTNIVKKLKAGQTANTDITVNTSSVDVDNLLTLSDGIVTLTSQLPFESVDNTTTATLTFLYGGISKTLLINITIEKQDKIITDEDIVIAEMPKYQTTSLITKDILAGTDITANILKLKDGQTANPEVDTFISHVDLDGLLTLNDRVVTLTDQIPFEASDNETVANISFVKGEALRTISVFVTIEKQDEQVTTLVITADYDTIMGGDTNTYTINTDLPVYWSLINNASNEFTLNTSGTSNTCTVTAKYSVGAGDNATLIATVEGVEYIYEIIGESW